MINKQLLKELEKQFFDAFEIEPHREPSREYNSDGEICSWYIEYPQITDRQYLELICLYTKEIRSFICHTSNLKMLKEEVLKEFISEKDGFIKHQVQELFKRER